MRRIILVLLLGVLTRYTIGHRGWSRHQPHHERASTPALWWQARHSNWDLDERWSQRRRNNWGWRHRDSGTSHHRDRDHSGSSERHEDRWFNMNSIEDCNLGAINIKKDENVVVTGNRRPVPSGSCKLYFQAPNFHNIKFKFDDDVRNYFHHAVSLTLRKAHSPASPWLTYNERTSLPSKYRESESNILEVEFHAPVYRLSSSTFKLNIKVERNYAPLSTIATHDLTSTNPPTPIPTSLPQPETTQINRSNTNKNKLPATSDASEDLQTRMILFLTGCKNGRHHHHSGHSGSYYAKFIAIPLVIVIVIAMLCLVLCLIEFRTQRRAERAKNARLASAKLIVSGTKKSAQSQPPPTYDHYLTNMVELSPQYDDGNPPPYNSPTKTVQGETQNDKVDTQNSVNTSSITLNVTTGGVSTIEVPDTPTEKQD